MYRVRELIIELHCCIILLLYNNCFIFHYFILLSLSLLLLCVVLHVFVVVSYLTMKFSIKSNEVRRKKEAKGHHPQCSREKCSEVLGTIGYWFSFDTKGK